VRGKDRKTQGSAGSFDCHVGTLLSGNHPRVTIEGALPIPQNGYRRVFRRQRWEQDRGCWQQESLCLVLLQNPSFEGIWCQAHLARSQRM